MDVSSMDMEHQGDVEFDESSEAQIVIWRTLINFVKVNPVLYEKHHKGYNKRSDKLLMWNRIGISLIPPMTGTNAEKQFYRLRQRFGKERRKVLQTQPRSGASGNDVPYKSNWILYNDLMFLADHIQPRQDGNKICYGCIRTTSNYQRSLLVHQKIPSVQVSQQLSTSPVQVSQQLSTSPVQVSQQLSTSPVQVSSQLSTPSLSSNKNSQSDSWILLESSTGSEIVENDTVSYTIDSEDSNSSVALTSSTLSNLSSTAAEKTFKTIVPQKLTPLPDTKKKRKRGSTDEMDAMVESSKNVSSLASTLQTVLKGQSSIMSQRLTVPGMTAEVENMLGSIALGLSKVSVDCHMDCLIRVLSCINEFAKK